MLLCSITPHPTAERPTPPPVDDYIYIITGAVREFSSAARRLGDLHATSPRRSLIALAPLELLPLDPLNALAQGLEDGELLATLLES